MKLNLKGTLGAAIACCLALSCSAFAAGHGNGAGGGNSSFGHSQGNADMRTTGSVNSAYGRTTSANARAKSHDLDDEDDDSDVVKTKKTKTAKHTWSSYPGNSYFGRNQRINHFKGSGNNAHGKTTSANAKLKHTKNQ
jgi:hypothetical protein